MNRNAGAMMQAMGKMRQAVKTVSVTGRAGKDLVVCTFSKKDDLSTILTEMRINPQLIRDHPEKLESLVKEAVNDGLSKEMQEIQAAMPRDTIEKLDKMLKFDE